MKPFGVESKNIRIGTDQFKGYKSDFFQDSFGRYILPVSSVPPSQSNDFNNLGENQNVPENNGGTDEKYDNQLNLFNWDGGTDEKQGTGGKTEKTQCHGSDSEDEVVL